MARPTAVTLMGRIFVVIGILALVSAIAGFGMTGDSRFGEMSLAQSASVDQLDHILRYASFFGVVLGLTMIASGSAFLRSKAWGRNGLELLCWFALAGSVIVASIWLSEVVQAGFTADFLTDILEGVVPLAIFIGVPVVMIRSLRRQEVRLAMSPAGEGAPPSATSASQGLSLQQSGPRFRNKEEYEVWKGSQSSRPGCE